MTRSLHKASLGSALVILSLWAQASEQDTRNSIALGALTYADNCRKCHQLDGYGEEALYPSLHKPELLRDKSLLIQTIIKGRQGHRNGGGDAALPLMPGLDYLSNGEIAAVIAFISNSWDGQVLIVTEQEVEQARKSINTKP